MTKKVIKINNNNPDGKIIKEASNVLLRGGLVVYPTDTAYGLGANAYDKNAVEKVYKAMNRPYDQPTHVVVKDWKMIKDVSIPNKYAEILFNNFIPGPVTLILNKRTDKNIYNTLTNSFRTLGVRIPDFTITKMMSEQSNIPYTTPSANRAGEATPYSIKEVKKVLDLKMIDLVLDADTLPFIKPSTLVDLSNYPIKILREGAIPKSKILKKLNLST